MAGFGICSRRDFRATTLAAIAGSALTLKLAIERSLQGPVADSLQQGEKAPGRERIPWKVRPFHEEASVAEARPVQARDGSRPEYLRSLGTGPPAACVPNQRRPLAHKGWGRMNGLTDRRS